MIIITATMPVTTVNREAVTALCIDHSNRSRGETGCIRHHIHADCEDEMRLFYYEEWQDEAAVARHFAVPDSLDFVRQLTLLVGERPEIAIHRAEKVDMAEFG